MNDRCADVHAHWVHALVVGDPQLIVEGICGGRIGKLGREPDLSEGLRDDYGVVPASRAVKTSAHGRVESAYAILTMSQPRGGHDPHRSPRGLQLVEVLLGKVATFVQH